MQEHLTSTASVPAYLLSPDDREGLTRTLVRLGWLEPEESILELGRAGDGNMNCVLRVVTPATRFVLKQSRAWVEKYPSIPAPENRALIEGAFYQLTSAVGAVGGMMPRLIAMDADLRLLMFEDLGAARDCTSIYAGDRLTDRDVGELTGFLVELHGRFEWDETKPDFSNRAMRKLNHFHIFQYPLGENQIDLEAITPGLEPAASGVRRNTRYVSEVARLGERYLADGPSLVHGDFFPGSWLQTPKGLRVIDPEFCFFGAREFDVGVMLAHLLFASQLDRIEPVVDRYRRARPLDERLAGQFAGVELMRRLIGVAQLPLVADLSRKQMLLDLSERLVLGNGLQELGRHRLITDC